jgi:outer membrane protein TolC
MSRDVIFVCAALCSPMLACAGFTHQEPPGPRPLPSPWRPVSVVRERLPRGAAGEVVLDERDGLSPDEAALLAIDQNPRLRAARAERGIGEAELLAAGVLPNPRLDGSLDIPVASGSEEMTVIGYGAGLSWNVTPLLSRAARVAASDENLASIDLEIAWQEWQVAQAARLHAVRAIYLERRVSLARELEGTWRQRLDALRGARTAGAVTELDVTTAERSFADAQVARLEFEQHAVAERAELSRAIGSDPARDVVLDLSLSPRSTSPNRQTVLDELPRRRLDLIALQHAQRSDDEALRAAVIAQFPPVEIGFHARREVDQNTSLGIDLSFELPFFDRNQADVARAEARRTRVEAEYDARLLEARADVVRTLRELELVGEQLVAARDASAAARRLAEQAHSAAISGALNPLIAADILDRSYASRLRELDVEQTLVELQIALAVASGRQTQMI